MFTRLLIAVDGSDCSTRAAKYGLELAKRYDAAVDIVHVTGGEADEGQTILEETAELDVDLSESVETHLVEERPAKGINSQAADRDADLIVMGRRGRSGIEEHLLGSVTERVLRHADVPVLTVPNGKLGAETGTVYENILLTTDGSDVAEHAAPYGGDLAEHLGATLHLLTVLDLESEAGIFDAGGVSKEFLERKKAEGRDALDRLEEEIDASGVDIESSFVRGTTHTAIGDYATEHDIDLLIMASEGESNLVGQQIGSTTDRVLRTVGRPVLVIPVSE